MQTEQTIGRWWNSLRMIDRLSILRGEIPAREAMWAAHQSFENLGGQVMGQVMRAYPAWSDHVRLRR